MSTTDPQRFGTTLSPSLQRRLRLQAAAQDRTIAAVLAELLDTHLMTDAELAAAISPVGSQS